MKIRFYMLTIPRVLYFCSEDYAISTIDEIKNEAIKTYKKYKMDVLLTIIYENDRTTDFIIGKDICEQIDKFKLREFLCKIGG